MKKEYKFTYEVYDSINDLPAEDASLLNGAFDATKDAYAPYSQFHVGAKAKLTNGSFITGSNQENASFPVGICAERALISAASSLHPNIAIDTMAITYNNPNGDNCKPVSPCGMCRQALVEYEERGKQPMRIILAGKEGNVYVISKATDLLPLGFSSGDMQQEDAGTR
jgi:cytidine deaminase